MTFKNNCSLIFKGKHAATNVVVSEPEVIFICVVLKIETIFGIICPLFYTILDFGVN